MKASDLIRVLQEHITETGDMEVFYEHSRQYADVEFVTATHRDDTGEPCLLINDEAVYAAQYPDTEIKLREYVKKHAIKYE